MIMVFTLGGIAMLVHVPDHFSSNLRFNLKKLPAIVTDRTSILWGTFGWFLGLLMLWLGIFELMSFFKAEKDSSQSLVMVEIFAFAVILIALGLIIYSIFSFIRYKKFYFDGKEFQMIYRPAMGVKHQFREPLENYIGVRLRVLFVQSGLFNRNRYIIDLYHQDSNKIIPLYISTSNKNIRKIWENYANILKLPALSVGDRGLVQRDYCDLDKSVKELAHAGKLPFIDGGKFPAPDCFDIKEDRNQTVVSPKGFYWDAFSSFCLFICIAAIFVLLAGGIYLTIIDMKFPLHYWIFGGVLLCFSFYFALRLFASYSLSIRDDYIALSERVAGFYLKQKKIPTNIIESIELGYNPTIGRYSISIISDDEVITLGSRESVSDLMWLKDFVLRKLIGN